MSEQQPIRALVTGATGFIGSHLVRRLKSLAWQVHALVRPESNRAGLTDLLSEQNIHIHDGTVGGLSSIIERTNPTLVFHLASLFLSQHTSNDIPRLIQSNIEFPAQLAQAMATHRIPYLINTGTAWQHYENADYSPANLYAATKQACVDLLRFYTDSAAFRVINLELFDTYGPSDPRPKLFSILRSAAPSGGGGREAEPLAMSPGDQLIDLVYIDDIINAFLAAAARIQHPAAPMQTFAISSGNPLPLKQLVILWQNITKRRLNIQWGARPYRPREVMHPWNRGTPLPGWRPVVSLEQGIRRMEGLA